MKCLMILLVLVLVVGVSGCNEQTVLKDFINSFEFSKDVVVELESCEVGSNVHGFKIGSKHYHAPSSSDLTPRGLSKQREDLGSGPGEKAVMAVVFFWLIILLLIPLAILGI